MSDDVAALRARIAELEQTVHELEYELRVADEAKAMLADFLAGTHHMLRKAEAVAFAAQEVMRLVRESPVLRGHTNWGVCPTEFTPDCPACVAERALRAALEAWEKERAKWR